MALSLLLLGGYAAAKTCKSMSNVQEWNKLVANYELEKDFEKVLKLCGKGDGDVNWANKTPEINDTVIDNCVKNLKTIPYLTEKDIYEFEVKAWDTKLKQIHEHNENEAKMKKLELEEITNKIKYAQKHRKTINIFNRNMRTVEYSKIMYAMCKETIWGDLVYNPPFFKWLEENDIIYGQELKSSNINPNHHWLNMPMPCGHSKNHEIWVIDEPIGYDGVEIYWKCRKFIQSSKVTSTEERKARSNKAACERLLKYY